MAGAGVGVEATSSGERTPTKRRSTTMILTTLVTRPLRVAAAAAALEEEEGNTIRSGVVAHVV